MIDLLEKLQKLQLIDNSLKMVENSKEGLPKIVAELEAELEKTQTELTKIEGEHNIYQQDLKTNKDTIEESNTTLAKYKEQRNLVTNNKEYEAINNEMKYRENLIVECEGNISELNSDIEKVKIEIEKCREVVEGLNKRLEDNRSLLKEKVVATEEEEKKLLGMKSELVTKIPERYMRLYNKIASSKDGIAVVYGDRGHCGGCRSILPSQKTSELKRKSSLVHCDACNRILTFGFIDKDLLNENGVDEG